MKPILAIWASSLSSKPVSWLNYHHQDKTFIVLPFIPIPDISGDPNHLDMALATSSLSGLQFNLPFSKNRTPILLPHKSPASISFIDAKSPFPPLILNKFTVRSSSVGFNGNIGSNSSYSNINGKIYRRQDSCLVIPPPRGTKPRAIIKFLGGAFIGAVPEVTYGYLLELLAKEGFFIISVPYNVTFDHSQAANQVYERFNACLENILASGLDNLTPADLVSLPIYSVGHSNGALLQVLTGSYFCEKIPKANAIIAYNNRPATEAVPYFEQLGPLLSQVMPMVEAFPVYSMARSATDDALKMLLNTAGQMVPDQEALVSLTKFADQLPSVFGQVREGTSEFKPTPPENRERCRNSYNVPHTLLVKFNVDAICETDLLEETLKPRVDSIGGTLEKVQLSGNHITPCVQEPKWEVGDLYTPADAIAQGLKTLSLNEIRVLSKTVSDWFRRFED